MLSKIECFIQPSKLDEVKEALFEEGVEGMTISEVQGFGHRRSCGNGGKANREVSFCQR